MPESDVRETLWKYCTDPKSDFAQYHAKHLGYSLNPDLTADQQLCDEDGVHIWSDSGDATPNGILKLFLFATLDEVRLFYAEKYAEILLQKSRLAGSIYFRKAMLRREVIDDVAFHRQRDHAAHTLNNYLLGWYIYTTSKAFRDCFKALLGERLQLPNEEQECQKECRYRFGNIWILASLLHDIGYMFEGSVENRSPEIQSHRIRRAARIVEDYFAHRFWDENGAISVEQRQRLRRLVADLGVRDPSFDDKSIAAVASGLRSLGELDKLRERIAAAQPQPQQELTAIETVNGLPGDSFELWASYFSSYPDKGMSKLLSQVEKHFREYMWDGTKHGYRVLDHGVCSGLLTLLCATRYDIVHAGTKDRLPDKHDEEARKQFKGKANVDHLGWWQEVLWGTAAAAVHNIVQDHQDILVHYPHTPITYLGILVDILQEWDRNTTARRSAFDGNTLPLQSSYVTLEAKTKLTHVRFEDPSGRNIAMRVRSALDESLRDWNQIVKVGGR